MCTYWVFLHFLLLSFLISFVSFSFHSNHEKWNTWKMKQMNFWSISLNPIIFDCSYLNSFYRFDRPYYDECEDICATIFSGFSLYLYLISISFLYLFICSFFSFYPKFHLSFYLFICSKNQKSNFIHFVFSASNYGNSGNDGAVMTFTSGRQSVVMNLGFYWDEKKERLLKRNISSFSSICDSFIIIIDLFIVCFLDEEEYQIGSLNYRIHTYNTSDAEASLGF